MSYHRVSMGSRPLVDIIMPTYNHERYIAQAVESVLAQECDFAYRLVIADDCSDDSTPDIVRSYAAKHPERIEAHLFSPRVGAFHRDRVSVRVLRECEARYVALLEGDDYWTDPRKLQKQVDYLDGHPGCSVVYHDAIMFYDDGSESPRRLCAPGQKRVASLEDIVAANFLIPCTALFRNVLGELPEEFYAVRNADWFLYVLLAEHGTLDYIDEVMAAYRVHRRGVWSSLNYIEQLRAHINTYEMIDSYLGRAYHDTVSAKIAEYRERLAAQYRQRAVACLDECHALARAGHPARALRPLAESVRSAPAEILLRPRRLAALFKNLLAGALGRNAAGLGADGGHGGAA